MESPTEELSATGQELDVGQQWVHLLPLGKFTGFDGRKFLLSDPAALIEKSLEAGRDLPIDYEHQSEFSPQNGQPAPAAGWIENLELRQDGVWGFVRWTERARKMIEQREYRYLSPVLLLNKASGEAVKLIGAGLTNVPNLNLKALNKQEAEEMSEMNLVQELAGILDLGNAADHHAVVNKVKSLQVLASEKRTAVPADQVAAVVSEYNSYRADVEIREAEEKVTAAMKDGILPPVLKDWALSLCRTNPAAFDEFVGKSPVMAVALNHDDEFSPDRLERIANRVSSEQSQIAKMLGIDPQKLASRDRS